MTNVRAESFFKTIGENRTRFMFLGIVLILLGLAAMTLPHVTSLSIEKLVGWLLFASGLMHFFHAFSAKGSGSFIWQIIITVLQAGTGLLLLTDPFTGVITLTVLLSVMFIGEGVVRSFFAFSLQPHTIWKWVLLSGIVSLTIGVLTFSNMPSSANWAIGLLVGCNVAMAGIMLLMVVFSSKNIDPAS